MKSEHGTSMIPAIKPGMRAALMIASIVFPS
jgi:hypothetical protein